MSEKCSVCGIADNDVVVCGRTTRYYAHPNNEYCVDVMRARVEELSEEVRLYREYWEARMTATDMDEVNKASAAIEKYRRERG